MFSYSFSYSRFLSRHPSLVMASVAGISILALVTTVTLKDFPDFTDPQAVRKIVNQLFDFH